MVDAQLFNHNLGNQHRIRTEEKQAVLKPMSEDEFFEFLQTRDERWELIDGCPVMLGGANQRHQAVVANTASALFGKLRRSQCRTTMAKTGIRLSSGNIRYPDIVVDCGPLDEGSMFATTPTIVIEVLSSIAESVDLQKRLCDYKSAPAVQLIILIDPDDVSINVHRSVNGRWAEENYSGIEDLIDVPDVGASLMLKEIYDGL